MTHNFKLLQRKNPVPPSWNYSSNTYRKFFYVKMRCFRFITFSLKTQPQKIKCFQTISKTKKTKTLSAERRSKQRSLKDTKTVNIVFETLQYEGFKVICVKKKYIKNSR